YTDEFEIKNFAVNINNKGKIKVSKKVNYKNFKGCYANSLSNIIIFGDKGSVFLLPAYLIESIDNNGVKLSNLIDEFNENEESIVNIFAITEFNDEESFYFISENGYVKKTMLNEFQGNYSYTKGYKLKDKDGKLINVLKKDNKLEKDILLITKKDMRIRFDSDSINPMGKIASGVTGISLSEDDKVIFGEFIYLEDNDDKIKVYGETKNKLEVMYEDDSEEVVILKDINNQNRAGKGKKIRVSNCNSNIKFIK
ncbi:DNA gyrase C-terminal beta-propeller domain-containing protein, partial [Clostridium novyi]